MRPTRAACLMTVTNYLGTEMGTFAGLDRVGIAFAEAMGSGSTPHHELFQHN